MSVWYVGGGSSLWTCSCDCMCTHNVYHTHTHTLNICPALTHESGLPKLHISCIDSGTFVAICKQKKKSSIFFKRFYLFFRERGRKGEREGKKHQCVVASHAPPYWGPGPQPRHVPWLGIGPATLCFADPCSIPWTTPARAESSIFKIAKRNVFSPLKASSKALSPGTAHWLWLPASLPVPTPSARAAGL